MKITIGDLVTLRGHTPRLLGMIVKIGEERRRMYGDGIEFSPYADVLWFNEKYNGGHRRFAPPACSLDVVSSVKKILDNVLIVIILYV